MAILWMGGEDIDFPNGGSTQMLNAGGSWRSGYSRATISGNGVNLAKSTLFQGGAVTSLWLSFRNYWWGTNDTPGIGVGQSGTNSGIFFAFPTSGIPTIGTYNGTTFTTLATSSTAVGTGSLHKFDLLISSYGTSGTITVYVDGAQYISYTGNITVSGVTGFDSVFIAGSNQRYSEIIVADESTLSFQGLVTLAPNANGPTQQWTNPAYTNINPTTINDANSTYVNATGDDEQVGLSAIPAGVFTIKAVKTSVRAMASAGSAATGLQVGFRNASGTVDVNPSHAVGSTFTTYEDYFTTDPTTGAAWASLTSYDLDLRSALG